MVAMDIFQSDAFNMMSLTQALEKIPHRPTLLGMIPGVFGTIGVRTETIAIEKRDGVLNIIQTSNRGAPLEQRERKLRDVRDFRTARIAKGDRVNASEIQNIRAFGTESELTAVQQEVAQRFTSPTGILNDVELTFENMRLGAIQGIVLDADGSEIYNWFDEWNITAASAIDFLLSTSTTNIREKCSQVIRQMARNAKGAWVEGSTQVHALVGDTFFDRFIDHDHVRQSYINWSAAADLREGLAFQSFRYGDIIWHNYRGTDDFTSRGSAGTAGIGVDPLTAKFFPVNAPGVFQEVFAPGESMDLVNTMGRRLYGLVVPDRDRNMYVDVEAYSYPLYVCTRPEMLQSATTPS